MRSQFGQSRHINDHNYLKFISSCVCALTFLVMHCLGMSYEYNAFFYERPKTLFLVILAMNYWA